MLTKRPRGLVLGAVALVVLAGCSAAELSSPGGEAATERATPERPDVAAPPEKETAEPSRAGDDSWDGYVEVRRGEWIPADGPGDCVGPAYISLDDADAEVLLSENLMDMGPTRFARGEVGYDDQGRVATYTVAAGDVLGVIGERLCLYNGDLIGMLNGHDQDDPVQPGEVLVIHPEAVPRDEHNGPVE